MAAPPETASNNLRVVPKGGTGPLAPPPGGIRYMSLKHVTLAFRGLSFLKCLVVCMSSKLDAAQPHTVPKVGHAHAALALGRTVDHLVKCTPCSARKK
jgi:hypothetical protein